MLKFTIHCQKDGRLNSCVSLNSAR